MVKINYYREFMNEILFMSTTQSELGDYTTVNSDLGTIESDFEIQKTDCIKIGKVISGPEEANNNSNRYATLQWYSGIFISDLKITNTDTHGDNIKSDFGIIHTNWIAERRCQIRLCHHTHRLDQRTA
jgi:hypothetical protein